jgi:hypothetical protein
MTGDMRNVYRFLKTTIRKARKEMGGYYSGEIGCKDRRRMELWLRIVSNDRFWY